MFSLGAEAKEKIKYYLKHCHIVSPSIILYSVCLEKGVSNSEKIVNPNFSLGFQARKKVGRPCLFRQIVLT